MKLLTNVITIALCLLGFSVLGQTSIAIGFEASGVEGCSPFTVTFSDTSTGPIVYRKWEFGNGNSATGNSASVGATYTNPGTYTVTLTISDGFDTLTLTKPNYIEVFDSPDPFFSVNAPTPNCVPTNAQFNNLSVPGGAPISGYTWDFGDGSPPNNATNPSHTYTYPGSFSVTLNVIDTVGCIGTKTVANSVIVNPNPIASFQASPSNVRCQPPLAVTFMNSSSGAGPLSYSWDYGIGTTTNPSPSAFYSSTGTYDVSLIVTDANGCADTAVEPDYIAIGTMNADFTFSSPACKGGITHFTNTSSGGFNYQWDFGNGQTSNQEDPTVVYGAPGTYIVSLTISAPGGGCSDSVSYPITVVELIPDFIGDTLYSCELPFDVTFSDNSTTTGTITNQQWDFGNGSNSSQSNPTATYIDPGGYYDVTYTVSDNNGCGGSITKPAYIHIEIPTLNFQVLDPDGCVPRQIQFINNCTPQSSFASWQWSFTSGQTSTLASPTINLTQHGQFVATVLGTMTAGCEYEYPLLYEGGIHHNPDFSVSDDTICAYDSLFFDNHSTDSNLITGYEWQMGDGGTVGGFEPGWRHTDTGWMNITLITEHHGCYDTIIYDSMAYVLGAVASINATVNCENTYEWTFGATILDADSFYWDFGDSSSLVWNDTNPVHIYDTTGNFLVKLMALNDSTGCFYEQGINIGVREPIADLFSYDSTPCLEDSVILFASESQHAVTFQYDLGFIPPYFDNSFTGANAWAVGHHTASLVVWDQNGCTDTTSTDLYIAKPTANFSASPDTGCSPLAVQFNDLSQSDTTIISWLWPYLPPPYATMQNPTDTFSSLGLMTNIAAQLIVSDTFGCTDTLLNPTAVSVFQPHALFSLPKINLCIGETIFLQVIGQSSTSSYYWDFGNGTTATIGNPSVSYGQAGSYAISLTVTDAQGCDSTYVHPDSIIVHPFPDVGFYSDITDTTCYPANVAFYDTSIVSGNYNSFWQFGTAGTTIPAQFNPIYHTFTQPGVYSVMLAIESQYGCRDTLFKDSAVVIRAPLTSLDNDLDTACLGVPFTFTLNNSDFVELVTWDFGDGTVAVQPIDSLDPVHTYYQTGLALISFTYSDSAQQCVKVDTSRIYVGDAIGDFSLADTGGCPPFSFEATNTSPLASSFNWFLDGSWQSSAQDWSDTLFTSGNYSIMLIAENDSVGCFDTINQEIAVYPMPDAAINGPSILCQGDSGLFLGSGGVQFIWNTTADTTLLTSDAIWAQSPNPFTIGLQVFNTFGCSDSVFKPVAIQYPPAIDSFPTDTVIFLGQQFSSFAFTDQPVLGNWNPPEGVNCSDCDFPIYQPTTDTNNYTYTYSDSLGCFTYDTTFRILVDNKFNAYIPNAFTPNGDGINDFFNIEGYGIAEVKEFIIFNRWGEVVFESNRRDKGWNGKHKDKEIDQSSIFYYRIILSDFSQNEYVYEGKVLLLER